MAARRDDGAWGPAIHYPQRSASGEVTGYWVHRDLVYWKQPREGNNRVWHFAFLNDYSRYLSRDEGKGYTKNKDKSKNVRPAPCAGPGKGGKLAAPHRPAGQKGGSSSSTPGPPAPPSRS
eukprot:2086320-Pyramimonas_sp.AAC.1